MLSALKNVIYRQLPLEILSITFFHLWIAFFRKLFVIPIAWFLRCLIKIAFTTSVYCLFVLFLTSPAFPFSLTFPLPHLILKSNDLRNEGIFYVKIFSQTDDRGPSGSVSLLLRFRFSGETFFSSYITPPTL